MNEATATVTIPAPAPVTVPPEPSYALIPSGPHFRRMTMFPIAEPIAKRHGACVAVGCKLRYPEEAALRMDLTLEQAESLHQQLTAALAALKASLAGGAQ